MNKVDKKMYAPLMTFDDTVFGGEVLRGVFTFKDILPTREAKSIACEVIAEEVELLFLHLGEAGKYRGATRIASVDEVWAAFTEDKEKVLLDSVIRGFSQRMRMPSPLLERHPFAKDMDDFDGKLTQKHLWNTQFILQIMWAEHNHNNYGLVVMPMLDYIKARMASDDMDISQYVKKGIKPRHVKTTTKKRKR